MKNIIPITVIFFTIVLFNGCKKDEGVTTPTTGGQSFTCKVDGTDWSANAPGTPVVAGYVSNNLTIAASAVIGTTGEQFTFMLTNVTDVGTVNLGSAVGGSYASFTRTVGTTSTTFMTDATNKGTVQITKLDKTAKNVVGTFSFTAKSSVGSTLVNVTNGAFNVKY
ncbi:hypothetical protein KJ885_06140 [Patescibacteria group bacterium]|nr:hypothetical protein [Patescibacteria group bacterium]